MAALQFIRRVHLQHQHYSRSTLLKRLKGLVGLGGEHSVTENVKSQQLEVKDDGFMFENVPERFATVVAQSLSQTSNVNVSRNWEELNLPDLTSKYKLLKGCHEEFGALPPNNIVNESTSVQDFIKYYTDLRKPHIVIEVLQFQNKKLPNNLTFEGPVPFKPAKRK